MMTDSKFPPHGEFDLQPDGAIIVLRCKGPWNRELTRQIEAASQPLIEKIESGPWGVLVVASGLPIHIPESLELSVEIVANTKKRGRVATAIVFESSSRTKLAEAHLRTLYNLGGEKTQFFDSIDDASAWLHQQIETAQTSI